MGKFISGPSKAKTIDDIVNQYQNKTKESSIFAVDRIKDVPAHSNVITYDKFKECMESLYTVSGFPNTNPDTMDEATYKAKKEELVKSSRLYEPPKDTKLAHNDWED